MGRSALRPTSSGTKCSLASRCGMSRPMVADKRERPDASWSFAQRHAAALFDLSGAVGLVTGGSRGIGRGMAFALAQAGADVMITARNEDDLKATCAEIESVTGRRALYTVGDVSDREYLQATVDKCERELGGLDILVPNAGISAGAPAEDMSEADFQSVMDVNFMAVFALCQVAHPLLKRGGRGKVLTIGSEYSIYGSKNTIGYSSSKHAILGLTKSLAIGWAKDHIQVNCVIPGWIYTDLAGGAIDHGE